MELQNLIGLVLPPIIDLINKKISDNRIKYGISVLICIVVGVVININKLGDWNSLLGSIAVVFATAQTTYNLYWKKSNIRKGMK